MAKPPHFLSAYLTKSVNLIAADDNALVKMGTFKAILARLLLQIPVPGRNIGIEGGPYGERWNSLGAGSVSVRPLNVNSDGSVTYGTICAVVPTIGGTAINDPSVPKLDFTGLTGTHYVRVTITGTLAVTDDVFVRGFSAISGVALTVESTASADTDLVSNSGSFHFDLASLTGTAPSNNGWGPIGYELCDDLSGSATARLLLFHPGYTP